MSAPTGQHDGVLGDAGPQGDVTIARTVLEAALTSGERRLGHDHPELVPLLVDLAMIAQETGDLDEARQRLSRAYAIMVATDGPEHPTALMIEERLSASVRPAIVPAGLGWPLAESPWPPPDPPPERTERVGRHAAPEPDPLDDADANADADAARGYAPSPASPGVYDRLTDEADLASQAWPDEGSQIT